MKSPDLSRFALLSCVALTTLAGCSGHAGNGVVPNSAGPDHLPNHKSFYYTGGAQQFTVPAGLRQIKVDARGAKGAGSTIVYGGRVRAVIPVTSGEMLVVYVGGDGSGQIGGFNGGANGGNGGWYCYNRCNGFGGGGSSDIRAHGDKLTDRVVVVGGGGGEGAVSSTGGGREGGAGGPGGGSVGGDGDPGTGSGAGSGGGGGRQHAGGSGGDGGTSYSGAPGSGGIAGSLRRGGIGGTGSQRQGYPAGSGGGGGGGGYYGGGGGGAGSSYLYGGQPGGGGGGGSSHVERSATNVHMWQGWKNPASNGLIVLSW